jgi:hypothetical protein
LNGVVPLAALLNSAGSKSAAATSVKEQADRWIQYILAHRNTTTGWLGPDDSHGEDYWSGWNVVHSLLQHADANPNTKIGAECRAAALAYCLESARRQHTKPLTSWAHVRWQDWGFILQQVIDTGAVLLAREDVEVELVPYGATNLRLSGLPWVVDESGSGIDK